MSLVHQQALPGIAPARREFSASEMLQLALEKEANIEIIERMTALMRDEREYQAKVAFDEALNACQAEIGRIAPNRDRENGIKWLDYAGLDRVVRPLYIKAGFSIAFSEVETPDAMRLRMKATVSKGGISKDYFAEISRAATNQKMNAHDAAASAASRVKRYLLLDIFNIAVGIDADEKRPYVQLTERQEIELQTWVDALRQAPDLTRLKSTFADAYKYAKTLGEEPKEKVMKAYEDEKRRHLGGAR